MNVIHLISSEGFYGAENVMVNLAGALSQAGHDPLVAVFRDSRRPHTEVAEEAGRRGLPVEIVDCDGRFDWSAVAAVRRLIDRRGAVIVHTHGYKSDLYAYAATRRCPAALIATSHNWLGTSFMMRTYSRLDRLALRRFDRIAVLSDEVADKLRQSGISAARVTFIRNGIDVARFASAPPALRSELRWEGGRIIGFVGRMSPEKGGDVLLRAAPQVLAAHPDACIVMVGDGPEKTRWSQLASSLGIAGRVHFTGVRQDMPEVFRSIDLLVVPSLVEAMPLAVIEAMAAARPVIASAVGAVPALVTPGVTGLLVNPGDAQGLGSAVGRLLDEPALANRMGEAGQERAFAHYSAGAMARSYIQLYEHALADRQDSRRRAWQLRQNLNS